MTQQSRFAGQQRVLEEEIRKQYEKLQEHKPNILVVGRTGVGKSSLINAILGEKLAETGAGEPITKFYKTYNHPLVTLIDSMGWEGGSDGERRFRDDTEAMLSKRRTTNPDDHIHIVWYVIAAPDARFQEFDARLVREAFGGVPVLFVLTKCDAARPDDIAKVEQAIKEAAVTMAAQGTRSAPAPKVVGVVRTAAEPLPVLAQEPWGMTDVVEATRAVLPDLYKDAFDAAQVVDLSVKARRARAAVATAVAGAAAIGATPIPFSDSLLLTPLQVTMVGSIGVIYGFGKDAGSLTALIGSSIVPLAAESAGVTLAGNLIKFVPGAGTIVGGLIEGTVAASITATIGLAFQQAFHQMALMRIKGTQPVTVEAMSQFLKQALPQALETVRQRGVKNLFPGGKQP